MRLIRFLSEAEVPCSLNILRNAARRMSSMGDYAWRIDRAFEREQYEAARSESLIGGFEQGKMSCTMRLQREDPVYWPDAPQGQALYLHKLAVRKSAGSTGWPAQLVRFAIEEASLRSVKELRLDTLRSGPLPGLYEKLGFSVVGPASANSEIILMSMDVPSFAGGCEAG